jgi:hypothetical protein
VSAVDDDGQRTLRDHLRQGDYASPLIREIEGRQQIADFGRARTDLRLLQTAHEPINGVRESRVNPSQRAGESAQSVAE